jgi:hypothetical protein
MARRTQVSFPTSFGGVSFLTKPKPIKLKHVGMLLPIDYLLDDFLKEIKKGREPNLDFPIFRNGIFSFGGGKQVIWEYSLKPIIGLKRLKLRKVK